MKFKKQNNNRQAFLSRKQKHTHAHSQNVSKSGLDLSQALLNYSKAKAAAEEEDEEHQQYIVFFLKEIDPTTRSMRRL